MNAHFYLSGICTTHFKWLYPASLFQEYACSICMSPLPPVAGRCPTPVCKPCCSSTGTCIWNLKVCACHSASYLSWLSLAFVFLHSSGGVSVHVLSPGSQCLVKENDLILYTWKKEIIGQLWLYVIHIHFIHFYLAGDWQISNFQL